MAGLEAVRGTGRKAGGRRRLSKSRKSGLFLNRFSGGENEPDADSESSQVKTGVKCHSVGSGAQAR